MLKRKMGFYEKYIKRLLDIVLASLAMIVFFWVYILIALLVRVKLGSPVVFKQPRPGLIDSKTGKERIFNLYKFRTMTDERDANGNLLPDSVRLTKFGKWLRETSLDELLETWNIIRGDMSIIGPRPQLVRDMVFMTDEQRMRHTARPGLSGLAQIKGRNSISWEDKIKWDLKYIKSITFMDDLKILLLTIKKVFGHGESPEELNITFDYGDELLKSGKISTSEYNTLQIHAKNIISEYNRCGSKD